MSYIAIALRAKGRWM